MSFWTRSPKQPTPTEGSAGPEVGFVEAFRSNYDYSSKALSQLAGEYHFHQHEQETLDQIYERTGKRVRPVSELAGYQTLANLFDSGQDLASLPIETTADEEIARRVKEFESARNEAMGSDGGDPVPGLASYRDMWTATRRSVAQIAEQHQRVSERSHTAGGTAGGIIGGMIGQHTYRDPILLGSLFIPVPGFAGLASVGARVAARMGAETVIGGGSEVVQQFTGMQERRKNVGMPWSVEQAFTEAGFAAAGAGALRGIFEGGVAGIRRLSRSNQAAANYAKENLDTLKETNPQRNAPAPVARAGQRVHVEAMDRVYQASLDPNASIPLHTAAAPTNIRETLAAQIETREAVAQILEAAGLSPDASARIASDIDVDTLRRYQAAAARVGEAEGAEAAVAKELAAAEFTSIRAAATKIETLEAEKKVLETRIESTPTKRDAKRLQSVEKSIRTETEKVDQKLKAKLEELEAKFPELAAATKEARATRDGFGEIAEGIVAREAGAARIEQPVTPTDRLSPDQLLEETTDATDALQKIDNEILGDIQRIKQANRQLNETGGDLDIGFGERFDPQRRVSVETGPDQFTEMSVRDAFARFDDDDAMARAMKECSI